MHMLSKDNDKPAVTVIIVDGDKNLKACLESIKRSTLNYDIEVLIITSQEKSLPEELRKGFLTVEFIVNKDLVVSTLMNSAAKRARGDFLLFLTIPLEFQTGWLESLIDCLIFSEACAVTPKIVSHRLIVEAGSSFLKDGLWSGHGQGEEIDDPRYNYVREVEEGSRFALFTSRPFWDRLGMIDENIKDPKIALSDFILTAILKNYKVVYNPFCSFHLLPDLASFDPMNVEYIRPKIEPVFSDANPTLKKRILVLGIYLADKPNNAKDIMTRLSESKYHEIRQEWTSIGEGTIDEEIEKFTVFRLSHSQPKFKILIDMLQMHDLQSYDYVIITDDDIILPYGFVDEYIYFQDKFDFHLAQPARTNNSYIDHPITEKQRGILARQTLYVEIGPLFCVHRSAYNIIFPFDLMSPMGWGYGNVWSFMFQEKGLKMGIIDHTPVDHSMRKPVQHYSWKEADAQRRVYLSRHPHLKLEECFRVLEVFNY